MKTDYLRSVILLAALSRIFCVLLGFLSQAGARIGSQRNTIVFGRDPSPSWLYDIVSPLVQWDGIHFVNIASRGYDSVLSHAFFPGVPWMMRLVSEMMPTISESEPLNLALAGVIVSQVSFVLGSLGLYKLSAQFLGDKRRAFRATLFYIFPASNIFMSAVYTESPFSMLTFWGLYFLYCKKSLWVSASILAIACLFRSNGILAIAFLIHEGIINKKSILERVLAGALVYLPYNLYSLWSFNLYCSPDLAGDRHEWCSSFSSIYPFIQKEFWGVSLFEYWRSSNIPYFLLMIPALTVSVYGIVTTLVDRRKMIPSLFRNEPIGTKLTGLMKALEVWEIPFLFQMGVLTVFTVFIANCQILTRILTSCPLFFWSYERMWSRTSSDMLKSLMLIVQFGYYLAGPFVFSNGLNWT
jgi:phosphatidylinositol glycan class V